MSINKKGPWGDIFLGLGLAFLFLAIMITTIYIGSAGIVSIVGFILISASTFLSVKWIRGERPITGKIILAITLPCTFALLVFGACAVMLGGL